MLRENALRYGDIVHYRAINRKIYQINHPDLIQELLINDEPRNHRHMVMQRSRFILGTGLLTSEEPLHMRQRRMAAPAFHRHRIAAYGDVIAKYSAEMIEHWRPGPLDAYPEMMMLALRIVSKCLFDTDARSEAKKIGDAVDAFMGFLPLAFLPFSRQIEKLPFGPDDEDSQRRRRRRRHYLWNHRRAAEVSRRPRRPAIDAARSGRCRRNPGGHLTAVRCLG